MKYFVNLGFKILNSRVRTVSGLVIFIFYFDICPDSKG